MSVLVALARLLLAGVFVVSAVAKLRDRSGSRESVTAFGVPAPLVALVATGLPFVEVACAALLLAADPAATAGAVTALLLLAAFTVAIVVNLLRGRRPDCHCFGSLGSSGGIGWPTVVRNGLLMGLAGLSLVGAGGLGAVPSVLADLEATDRALLAAGAALLAVLAVMVFTLRTLMARYGAVLLRVEALEQRTGVAPPPLAPEFALPDLDGEVLTLDEVLALGRPALLVFVSPTCSNCTQLLPDVATWQADAEHPLSVVVISDGTVAENQHKTADVGPVRILLQQGRTLTDAYGLQGTPAAVLIGAEGRRAGQAAHGVDGVRSLHDTIVHAMAGSPAGRSGQDHAHPTDARRVSAGDPVPEVVLRTESDVEARSSEVLDSDAVLLFWRADCGYCRRIVDEVQALEPDVPVRLITGSDLSALRDSGLTSPVLRDPGGALEAWLRVPGTPSAARIRGGMLDSELAVGGPAVLEILRASARSSASVD